MNIAAGRTHNVAPDEPPVLPRPVYTPCPDVPLIGFHLADAIHEGLIQVKGAIDSFTEYGVRFKDCSEAEFDHIILATGFQATVGILGNLIQLDACGFASRRNRVVSLDQPNLYFVGHNYDGTGGLYNIARDAQIVGRLIAKETSRDRHRRYKESLPKRNGR